MHIRNCVSFAYNNIIHKGQFVFTDKLWWLVKIMSEKCGRGESDPPYWIKDGEVVTEELQAVVSEHTKKLASSSRDVQREGAEALLSLINKVWTLETHVARDSADSIAQEIR